MKYFGTDGFRGEVSSKLNSDYAYKIGKYVGYYYASKGFKKMIIGKDTRLSGDVLEHALAAGAASMGIEVDLAGVIPTPAISYLINAKDYAFGAMISASHNPYKDNGIKLFNGQGFKMDEEVELLIEDYLDNGGDLPFAEGLGHINDAHEASLDAYAAMFKEKCPFDLSGLKVMADLANGSATSIAVRVLESMGVEVVALANNPDGININNGCGSTHLDNLCKQVVNSGCALGIAFDGDADRLLAVDHLGNPVDGDVIMYLNALALKAKGQLNGNHLVVTVMSNIGLHKALKAQGIESAIVGVGDKYVSECLFTNGYVLGGEQSGHIIFAAEAKTGDGLLTAVHLLNVIKERGKSLNELSKEIAIYPQVLKNIRVKDKRTTLNDEEITALIDSINIELEGNGRILVRPSGTEELIRVMVEAETDEICNKYVDAVINRIIEKGL